MASARPAAPRPVPPAIAARSEDVGTVQRQFAFLAAFATGALWIVVVRELGPGLVGAFVAAFGCAAIIVAFAAIHFIRSKAEAFRAADDFYYLGLLFTLVSLIYVLVRVFVLGEGGGERTQQLIGNFGIALVSTVVGILVRVVLLGLDKVAAPEESEPSPSPEPPSATPAYVVPVADMGDDLAALREQVRQARDALSHFTRVTLAQANQTKSHSERLIDEFNERVDSMADDRLRALDTVESSLAVGTQRVKGQIDTLVEEADRRLAQAVGRADEAWRQLAGYAEQASDTARRRAETAGELTATMLESVASVRQSFESLVADATGASQSVSALDNSAGAASSSLAKIIHDIDGVTARTHAAHEAAADHLTMLRDTLASAREGVEPLHDLLAAVTHGARTLGEATGEVEAGIRASSEGLGRELDEATGKLTAALGVIASAGKAFESSVASLSSLDESIDRLRRSATAAATGLDVRANEIVAAHNTLAEGAKRSNEQALTAYGNTVRELADMAQGHREELRREAESWSRAMDALNASIREQQALAERNSAVATGLLEQLAGKSERGSGFLGIGSRR